MTIRRTSATLSEIKGPVKATLELLRHSRMPRTTDVYMQVNPEGVVEMVDPADGELGNTSAGFGNEPEMSKTDGAPPDSDNMDPGSQTLISSQPQSSSGNTGARSDTSTHNLAQGCHKAERRPLRAIELGAVSDPAVQMPCEPLPIPSVSARLLRYSQSALRNTDSRAFQASSNLVWRSAIPADN